MIAQIIKQGCRHSPAFVLDLRQVLANLKPLQELRRNTGCKVLYSLKALPLLRVLEHIRPFVDGFAASSLFEAGLARETLAQGFDIHLTSPGLRAEEFAELSELCSHVSFNSLSQFDRLQRLGGTNYSKGLRVNPKQSFAADRRYDPCRPHSKLGVDINLLQNGFPDGIEGLHLHTVFGQTDIKPLLTTANRLLPLLKNNGRLPWLNLGGGYLFHSVADLKPLAELIERLKDQAVDQVYFEPGKAIVGNAGYLLTTVLDRFESDGKTVLVLDTSVNHHPKVFEYQMKPVLLEEQARGGKAAILAGSTCLAGDLFGEYRFSTLPAIGDRLLFADVGAYSMIKANRFNGYALPDMYSLSGHRLDLIKHDGYEDYRRQWC